MTVIFAITEPDFLREDFQSCRQLGVDVLHMSFPIYSIDHKRPSIHFKAFNVGSVFLALKNAFINILTLKSEYFITRRQNRRLLTRRPIA